MPREKRTFNRRLFIYSYACDVYNANDVILEHEGMLMNAVSINDKETSQNLYQDLYLVNLR